MAAKPEQWLECLVCHRRQEVAAVLGGCPHCASDGRKSPLEMRYDYTCAAAVAREECAPGIWRWSALLPRVGEANRISLGEGNTPLVPIRAGGPRLMLKNETGNPTWSYKDRANCISISAAREFGFQRIFASSTGNHGNAAAAYSAAGGMRCVIFCHPNAPNLQLALMRHYGASVFLGGSQKALGRALVARGDWFPSSILCPRDGYANPFGVEGFKTIAFEIVEQLGGKAPDRVYAPVGSGDGFYGVWKGFVELHKTGVIDRLPRMITCQASGANPYVLAFRRGDRTMRANASANTIALSIAEKIGGDAALHAVYDSGGSALEVDDDEIVSTAKALAREGFAVEPASAAAVACARREAVQQYSGETWITIGTGATVKWPESICTGFVRPAPLPRDFADVDQLIAQTEGGSS
ncbi:MAG: pyridoxal-phosphate dependent enzyme [Bryobacteraceae bacterium]